MPSSPGPGTYSSTRLTGKEGPNYSINPRPKEICNSSPGPGSYQPLVPTVQTQAPVFSLGSNKRKLLTEKVQKNKNPGPGAAEVRDSLGESPAYGFGTSERKKLKDDGQPGPGTYEFMQDVGDSTIMK